MKVIRPSHTTTKKDLSYFLFYYGLFIIGLGLIIYYSYYPNSFNFNISAMDIILTHSVFFYIQVKKGFIFSELNSALISSHIYKKFEGRIMLGSFGILVLYGILGYQLYKLNDNKLVSDNIFILLALASILSIGGKWILENHFEYLIKLNRKDFR